MSSLKGQGAISSLVYSSSALTTAASLGYVFGKPSKSITSSLSSSSSSLSKKKNYVNTITINDNNFPVKKRFNLFRLKSNKHHRHRHNHCDSDNRNNNKIISDDVTFDKMIAEPETFIVNYFQTPPSTPPTSATNITYHHYHQHHHHHHHHNHHPSLMVLPDQLTTDDDVSSLCSDATSFYLSDRSKSCSVTTFATLSNTNINNININSNNNNNNNNNHSLIWDENNSNNNNNSTPMSLTNVAVLNGHNLTEILLEEDEEENWNDNSSVEEDKNTHSNNNLNSGDGGDDILIDSSSSSESSPSASRKKSKKKINRTSLPPPEHNRSPTPLKHHHRCKSLPPIPLSELSPSFYRQPTPSESWDNDFVLDDLELNVPNSVKDAQISLKMDIYTIKDFVSQIEELKTLYDDKLTLSCTIKSKMKRRRWSNGFLSNDAKKYNGLESMFKEHWEEAAVIIDLSEIAQDREPMFGGGKHVEVDIENIPSKRHLKVLKRIIEKEMANNNHDTNNTNNLDYYGDDDDNDKDENDDDKDDDDHKENHYKKPKLMFNNNHAKRFSLSSSSSSSSSKITTKTTRNKKKKEKKYSDFRISVEVMPSLVEHLRKLQERLTEHVNELKIIAKQ